MKFAVQLYSLREYIAENGLESALKIVSDAGFEGVEFAGFYGMKAEEIAALLEKYGLIAVSAHVGNDAFSAELPTLKALAVSAAVIPWIGFNRGADEQAEFEKTRRTLAEVLNETAAKLRPHGLKLGYHNHAHEFENGADYVKKTAEEVPGIKLELDVFWLAVAGKNALKYMEEQREKLLFLHVKELGESAEGVNPVVGRGRADCGAVMELGKKLKVPWSILEAEKFGMPEAEYLKESYAFMKNYR